MRPENGDISRLRIRIVKRDILLHGQVQSLFLLVGRGRWVFPDVFAWDQVSTTRKEPEDDDGVAMISWVSTTTR